MKKKFCIYLVLALCLTLQRPSYTRSEGYEELQRFLDDFHRMNCGDWVPEFCYMHAEFNRLLEQCSEESPQQIARVWERFISMSMRYYATPAIKEQLFKEAFATLGKDNKTIQATLSTINDVDNSWLLIPVKGFLISKFKKEASSKKLPTIDIPEMVAISCEYEEALEKLHSFLDRFHIEKLDSSVTSPESAQKIFNERIANIQSQFNAACTINANALYTFKIDICRAYTKFIPIVMQYYCDEKLVESLFTKAFSFLDEIDPSNSYPQATTLLEATEIMINAMNNIGKMEGSVGKIVEGVRGLLQKKFKKPLK